MVILIFGIIFVPKIIDRITNDDVTRSESRSKQVSNQMEIAGEELAYLVINDEKKKIMPFSFTNQDGQVITNKDYEGKVYLVEFFFTTCPTICPRMNRNLVDIQDELKQFNNFGIASFTINPENDTPEVLKEYGESQGADFCLLRVRDCRSPLG